MFHRRLLSLTTVVVAASSCLWLIAATSTPPAAPVGTTPPASPAKPATPAAAQQPAKAPPARAEPTTYPVQPTPAVHTPEEELKTFQLPEGYKMELVLSDPDIKEPVQCVFDGNGRMYIAELRSYMQDIDAGNEHTPVGRVSRHESTKGDGVFDKHTVFADGLLLPRMVLPLDRGQVVIGQTDSNDLHTFIDSKDDGVSDGKFLFYEGGPRAGNLEHQPSGLLWSMDNWIYITANNYRLRWAKNAPTTKETISSNGGQWGLAQDDNGKLWWSNAGAERGLWHFQTHAEYASIDLPEQFDPTFLEVWPVPKVFPPDEQGGPMRFRPEENTLNHFTASCGQEIFRGDRLPEDLRGNALICEPVGRLIRRAKVTVEDGITHLENPYEPQKSEFIRSTDPYFRPVNMTTGPDGCLYITEMYRGIIQEGNWVKEGSYLRKVVQQYGLDKNIGHGRVWRLVHKDFTPGPQPHMFDETPAQLVGHLEHPNGWWRDTAQKLLVLRQDKSVVPALEAMTRTSSNPQARMHAMWTLEGLGAITPDLLREKFKDANPYVRANAIRVSETLFKKGDASLEKDVRALADDADPNVAIQALETVKILKLDDWKRFVSVKVVTSKSAGVQGIGKGLLYEPKNFDAKLFTAADLKLLKKGQEVYQELCFACHGYDGLGMPQDGKAPGTTIAPPLSNARLVDGPKEGMLAVLLAGLGGPVEGKTYDAQMIPMRDNNDEWVASVASFVRNSFGNSASTITPQEVAKMRIATKTRTQPWTIQEIKDTVLPPTLENKSQWKATASVNEKSAHLAFDGKLDTRFTTEHPQQPGQWFQIELPEETAIRGFLLDAGGNDYPRGYTVEFSKDGVDWGKPIAKGKGSCSVMQLEFPPTKTKFIRITQTGSAQGTFWSIREMEIYPAPKSHPAATTTSAAPHAAG